MDPPQLLLKRESDAEAASDAVSGDTVVPIRKRDARAGLCDTSTIAADYQAAEQDHCAGAAG